jgi:4-hydroxy-2-oxoheptanedioate aldolase
MPNPAFSLARRLKAGETVHLGWATLGVPIMAELMAREGFVAVNLDQQHGLFTMESTLAGITQVRLAGAAPSVRIPLGDWAVASRVLDFGAEAIIAPMINTAQDARALAAATKYPPIGERSSGPTRAMHLTGLDLKSYFAQANDNVMVFAMTETQAALDNMDAILATPGIDGVFLGPSDLSIALSTGKLVDPGTKEVDAACDRIAAAAKKAGKIAAAFTPTPERANELAARGFRLLAIASDQGFFRGGAAAALKALKR